MGIRRDCAVVLIDFGRLLVVLFEDRHLCCFIATGGSVFEICESGEQGVSIAGLEFCEYLTGKLFRVAFDSIDICVNELPALNASPFW